MKTITIKGFIENGYYGENDDALFIIDKEEQYNEPIAEILEDLIANKNVTVRYWVTDKECSKDEAIENNMKIVMGFSDCLYNSLYSDYTGYLWTDENIIIGGHDLLAELQSNLGKFIILEIDIHE